MAHFVHVPETFRHANTWYWTAVMLGVAIVVAYLFVEYGPTAANGTAEMYVPWDFSA